MQDASDGLHFLHSRFESPSWGETVCLEPVAEENIFCNMVGQSALMKNLFQRMAKVSQENLGVVIEGGAGTGKKCVARAIHQLAWRGQGKMVSIRRGSLSDDGFDCEKIERYCRELGKVSLFFEVPEDLSLDTQEKLLRILEKRAVDGIRLMASSRHSLDDKMESGEFEKRFGQYFGERIRLPSLGERVEDLPFLLAHFLGRYSGAGTGGWPVIEKSALNRLLAYSWPGNVRELENLVEQWAALNRSEMIKSSDLSEKFFQKVDGIRLTDEGIDLKGVLAEIEDSLIMQALRMTGDNKNRASKLLRINRTTLIEKMKKKGLLKSN